MLARVPGYGRPSASQWRTGPAQTSQRGRARRLRQRAVARPEQAGRCPCVAVGGRSLGDVERGERRRRGRRPRVHGQVVPGRRDVKPIYTAVNAEAARAALGQLAETWGTRYGAIIRLWENAWTEFIPFLDYDIEIRKVLCSTDENVNQVWR